MITVTHAKQKLTATCQTVVRSRVSVRAERPGKQALYNVYIVLCTLLCSALLWSYYIFTYWCPKMKWKQSNNNCQHTIFYFPIFYFRFADKNFANCHRKNCGSIVCTIFKWNVPLCPPPSNSCPPKKLSQVIRKLKKYWGSALGK